VDEQSYLKDEREEKEYKRHLLEAILVASITESSSKTPTIKEFILSEIVNGTIEYIGGRFGKKDYQSHDYNSIFVVDMFKYLNSEMKLRTKRTLDTKVATALKELCRTHPVNPGGIDIHYRTVDLYDIFEDICPISPQSTFTPPYEMLIRIQKEFLPSLSPAEKNDIEGIGKAMRKYIDNDLAFLG